MKKKNLLLLGLLMSAMLVLVFSVTYALPIINIDTFDSDSQTFELAVPNGPLCDTLTGGNDMVGGVRDISLERLSGSGDVKVEINETIAPNAMAFSVAANTTGRMILQWDETAGCSLTTEGLTSLNLAPNDGLYILVQQADQGMTIKMRIYTTAANYSDLDYTWPYDVESPGHLAYFPFDTFTPHGTGADFTDVGSIEVEIEGSSLDMVFDVISSDFARDYGDLPAAYNNTTNTPTNGIDDGARHIINGIYLGSLIDSELDGQEASAADGDAVRSDDEDGLDPVIGSDWGDGSGDIDITVVAPDNVDGGCVVGFIDWDGNNIFDSTGTTGGVSEIVYNAGVYAGSDTISIDTPERSDYLSGDYPATLNARFRIFAANDPIFAESGLSVGFGGCPRSNSAATDLIKLVYGEALDGEVEDYQWGFSPTAVSLQNVSANSTSTLPTVGIIAFALLAIIGTGVALTRRQQG